MTQADTEACGDMLSERCADVGVTAQHYHAGMTSVQRKVIQRAWQNGDIHVVCRVGTG